MDELAPSAKPTGLTEIVRTGAERSLPAPVDLAAYRIARSHLPQLLNAAVRAPWLVADRCRYFVVQTCDTSDASRSTQPSY
ncbi:hypothetical protein ACFQ6S_05755 [Streptomyces sp. NPDC056479]|uniref:hypothetical protein n=1 Tax=Streptomyces sp. NPDC056479 TaxID=3345832 RepID=UPI003691B0DA